MTLVKKIKDGTNSWRDKPENVYILSIEIYRYNPIPVNNQLHFFTELEQQQQKVMICMEIQDSK